MKLATFTAGGEAEIGVIDGERMISLTRSSPGLARDMIDLIARWGELEHQVRGIAKAPLHVLDRATRSSVPPLTRRDGRARAARDH